MRIIAIPLQFFQRVPRCVTIPAVQMAAKGKKKIAPAGGATIFANARLKTFPRGRLISS
jgi:ribosomal protein L18E